ncbi:MAG: response regulator [Deltaproteobacteria bacterium]|nr:response regulator [Deltaproteobacteria bacterium]
MKKIMIADDEEMIRSLVSATLEDDEYIIIEASDGERALTLAQEEKPDLLLLDVKMPGKSGFEVCRTLKSDPKTKSVYIIMLTGQSRAKDIKEGKQAGADDYFTKPFSPLSLLKKIGSLLR